MSSMWSQMSGLPGSPPIPPSTGGVTPLPWTPPPPQTGGVTPLPGTAPQTGGVMPLPWQPPPATAGQGIDESAPIGTPPPNTGGVTPLPPRTGGVYPNPVVGPGDTHGQGINERGPGSIGNGANPPRQPEWVQRPQPSFRRPNFWQAVRQMAQPSVSNSAANQARAQQQQSNAARARAAFLSGFNNVRRPMNQYREREQGAAPYAGGIDRGNGLYSPGMRPQTGGGDPYNSNPHGGPSEFAATNENVRIGYQYGGGPAVGNQPRGYAY